MFFLNIFLFYFFCCLLAFNTSIKIMNNFFLLVRGEFVILSVVQEKANKIENVVADQ